MVGAQPKWGLGRLTRSCTGLEAMVRSLDFILSPMEAENLCARYYAESPVETVGVLYRRWHPLFSAN